MTFPSDDSRILPLAQPRGAALEPLAGIVASIRDAVIEERRRRGLPVCRVMLDVSAGNAAGIGSTLLRGILAPLLERAIDVAARAGVGRDGRSDAPALREVVVTSIESADAIEIEVADSGPGLPREQHGMLEPAIRSLLDRVGGTLSATNCPEGGAAFTVRLPHPRRKRMAA